MGARCGCSWVGGLEVHLEVGECSLGGSELVPLGPEGREIGVRGPRAPRALPKKQPKTPKCGASYQGATAGLEGQGSGPGFSSRERHGPVPASQVRKSACPATSAG
jgi:hypothetical protein